MGKGLSKDVARSLIIQTLEGAAAMMKQTGTMRLTKEERYKSRRNN